MAEKASSPNPILPESFEECVELYFECETPEERDGFIRLFAEREGESETAFLRAMMVEDEDEFVRLAAASALAKRGDEDAMRLLAESLDVSADDAVLEAAIAATIEVQQEGAAEALCALFLDDERSVGERRLAQDGLTRAHPKRAAEVFASCLDSVASLSSELIEGMMPALIDAEQETIERAKVAIERRIALIEARRRLLEQALVGKAEGDEKEIALDKVDEAREAWERLCSCHTQLVSEQSAA